MRGTPRQMRDRARARERRRGWESSTSFGAGLLGCSREGAPRPVKHRALVILIVGLTAGACRRAADQPPPVPQRVIAWGTVRSWWGHGNKQTESFTSESGALRVRWTTTDGTRSPGRAGVFRVTAHSA